MVDESALPACYVPFEARSREWSVVALGHD